MKVPDLSTAADAGVHDWTGAPEPLKTAAAAAKLRFCSLDLHGIDNKTALLGTLGKSLKLPEHFGDNWDALADCLEDSDWLGAHGIAIVLRHAAAYRKAHAADWETLSDILSEAAEYCQERHKPFWVFVS
jgi:RNAse (barnase) inhibitor barstar